MDPFVFKASVALGEGVDTVEENGQSGATPEKDDKEDNVQTVEAYVNVDGENLQANLILDLKKRYTIERSTFKTCVVIFVRFSTYSRSNAGS